MSLMVICQPYFDKQEHARLGTAIYEEQVRPQVEADYRGKAVAIDIETSEFEVADDTLTASERLLRRRLGATGTLRGRLPRASDPPVHARRGRASRGHLGGPQATRGVEGKWIR